MRLCRACIKSIPCRASHSSGRVGGISTMGVVDWADSPSSRVPYTSVRTEVGIVGGVSTHLYADKELGGAAIGSDLWGRE